MQKSIPINDLKVGMFLVSYGQGTFDSPLVSPRRIVERPDEIDELRDQGVGEVVVDLSLGSSPAAAPQASPGEHTQHIISESELAKELPVAFSNYTEAVRHARELLDSLRRGNRVELRETGQVVDGLVASVRRNDSAAVCMATLASLGAYHATHLANVGIYAAVYAQSWGMDAERQRLLCLAGFLHDVGKARVPLDLLDKQGRLSPHEYRLAKAHVLEGYRILKDSEGVHPEILRGVVEHHERYDGSGYPRGAGGDDIGEFGHILAVADTFDALTSTRPHCKPKTSSEAFRILYSGRGKLFEAEVVERFIKALGVYPVGSFVRLSDGCFGVVCRRHLDKPLRPTVRVVFDQTMRPRLAEVVDLACEEHSRGQRLEVAECANPRDFQVDVYRLLS